MKKLEFVHQFLPATAPGSRTLLLLHGTGGDESDLIPPVASSIRMRRQ